MLSADVERTGLGATRQLELEDCRKLAADRGWSVGDDYVGNDVSAFSDLTGMTGVPDAG